MRNHPEQTPDEFYVGNHRGPIPAFLAELKTARLGLVAYDLDGKRLPANYGLRPLIIGRVDEARFEAIMAARLRAAARGERPAS